ncbi:MAG: Hsp20/alpha crystallin family protein, partial [Chloroherpetonaceae bacterium]|nr:Hsp20/alpha crystallin family protein [Chloroherpetonaceae bacterium]
MGSRDFNPLDVFLQLEADLLQGTGRAMHSLRFQPCMDMYETDSALIIKLELAGVHADRLNITLSADDRTLTVSGERAESNEERRDRVRCYQLEI